MMRGAGAVKNAADQVVNASEIAEQAFHFIGGEDHRQSN